MRPIIIDIATCPIDGVDAYIEEPRAPENYKDPVKIAAYILEAKAKACEKAALDPDLGRISMIGFEVFDELTTLKCEDDNYERFAIEEIAHMLKDGVGPLVGFNSLKFDWPVLLRRAMYLGVTLKINLDKYRSPHIDLLDRLTHHGLLTSRGLGFYVKRLGWTDLVKPLSGAEEALAPSQGRWDELAASVRHDVVATRRLAEWMDLGLFEDTEVETAEPLL